MKKRFLQRLGLSKGESTSSSPQRYDEESHPWQEEAEEYHHMVPYAPPTRVYDPESGLMLSPEELQKLNTLHTCTFASTGIIDPDLLHKTGMSSDFETVFNTIGWGGFWMVPELGKICLPKSFYAH